MALLRFASEKIGWDQVKVDSSLLPVLKRMNARTSHQQPITHYMPRALPDVSPQQRKGIKSRRIRNVVARLTNTGLPVIVLLCNTKLSSTLDFRFYIVTSIF